MAFLSGVWSGRLGYCWSAGIFFACYVMVGGDGGVVGPKELVGWVCTVTDGRAVSWGQLVPVLTDNL
jgi:hypothetical protein